MVSMPGMYRWWGCPHQFRSISQTFDTSNEANLMFRARIHYFRIPKLQKCFRNEINHSTPLEPKWCLRVFRSILQTFDTSNEAKLVFQAWMHYFKVTKLRKWFHNEVNHSTPLDPQIMFESVSEHFANLQHVKRGKTCVSGVNALFQDTQVVKFFHNEFNHSTH